VPFGQVVERGMLRPGEELFSLGSRLKAKVRAEIEADGSTARSNQEHACPRDNLGTPAPP